MSRSLGIVLLIWNAILTALLAWALMRTRATPAADPATSDEAGVARATHALERDTTRRPDARIAFFYMDSLRKHLDLLQERSAHYKKEGQRLEDQWQNELAKAQGRYEELVNKDRTYSTQAEIKTDKEELERLDAKIGELKQRSEERMARLEMEILAEVSKEIEEYLKEFNAQAGFDYIVSLEPGGQIWPGDPGLDVTQRIIDGLNARHKAGKNVPVDKAR